MWRRCACVRPSRPLHSGPRRDHHLVRDLRTSRLPCKIPSQEPVSSGQDTGAKGKVVTLEETLARAQEAAVKAEEAIEKVDKLPSAYPEPLVPRLIKQSLRKTAQFWLLAFSMSMHVFGGVLQWIGGAIGGLAISVFAYRRGSLSKSGMIAACFVGLGSLGTSMRCGIILLSFFFSSSKLTKWKEEMKSKFDAEHKKGGQRDWLQVLSNGGIPTLLALAYGSVAGFRDVPLNTDWSPLGTLLMGSFLGYYACCCGDTWASEVGVISRATPRLIISGRPVRKGVNGGVTLLGLAASVAGGLFMGISFYVSGLLSAAAGPGLKGAPPQWPVIALGVVGGFVGSIIDSILGATLQFSGFDRELQKVVNRPGDPDNVFRVSGVNILSNNQVNIVSASLTAALIGRMAVALF